MTNIAIVGCNGKMGYFVASAVKEIPRLRRFSASTPSVRISTILPYTRALTRFRKSPT